MDAISSNLAAFRGVDRSFTRTETGGLMDFQRELRNGQSVTGETVITRNDDGSATLNATRTGPGGNTRSVERTVSAEEIDAFKDRLNALGQRLAENPVTLPGGATADGSVMLRVSA